MRSGFFALTPTLSFLCVIYCNPIYWKCSSHHTVAKRFFLFMFLLPNLFLFLDSVLKITQPHKDISNFNSYPLQFNLSMMHLLQHCPSHLNHNTITNQSTGERTHPKITFSKNNSTLHTLGDCQSMGECESVGTSGHLIFITRPNTTFS